jgi:hypothetical protein
MGYHHLFSREPWPPAVSNHAQDRTILLAAGVGWSLKFEDGHLDGDP